jgi:mRNA interferase MazF
MRRGEVWTVAGAPNYAGKPRPAVIVQDDRFDATQSVTICAFTSNAIDAPLLRIAIEPSERNGLRETSSLMVDKITTVQRAKLGRRIGRLDDEDVLKLNRSIVVFLGLAGPPTAADTARQGA